MRCRRGFAAAVCLATLVGIAVAGGPRVVLTGTVQVAYEDDFASGQARLRYWLTPDSGERVVLQFAEQPDVLTGTRLRAEGALDGDVLTVSGYEVAAVPSGRAVAFAAVTGVKRVAVVLIDFQDSPSTRPFTPEQARGSVFTDPTSTNAFYQEQSSGQVSLEGKLRPDGDVFGGYRISANAEPPAACDVNGWSAGRSASPAPSSSTRRPRDGETASRSGSSAATT